MKHLRLFILAALLVLAAAPASRAIPVFNMPTVRIQPNGDTVRCFVSGDEYYHRLHDANNYTIVQNPSTGYWVFADTVHTVRGRWEVVATDYVAGVVDPTTVHTLHPNVGVDPVTWQEKQHYFDIPKEYGPDISPKTSGVNHGKLNNLVVFIRFSDETAMDSSITSIDAMFNDSSATATSMNSYFKKVSYNKIDIVTYYYPTPSGTTIVSYQDSLPRSYYKPYDATTNPNGYQNDTERRTREFGLLERAVNYINSNYPVPSTLNIDMDNDGYVDNICFVVKGTYTGWSDLLWPHKWSLYDRNVYINGKRVYTFNLQLEGSGSHYFSSSTFCHEMFHTLGAPDLYRYNNYTNVSGVGSWDLMCSNSTPPQHMSAYMKWKYGNWLDSIPTITVSGTYTLHSVGDDEPYNNCYKIAAQEPHQWYVLEYRDNTERFETTLPGRGLLIYRIDDRYNGNASFDGVDYFDEVYLFRPNAHDDTTNGSLSQAYFSGNTTRTSFTPQTNPHPWLTGNVIDTTFAITDVTSPGLTISFTYSDLRGCVEPYELSTTNISGHSADLSWASNSGANIVQWRPVGSQTVNSVTVNSHSYQLNNLALNTQYQWRVRGVCGVGDSSAFSDWSSFRTAQCYELQYDSVGTSDTSYYTMPLNVYYNYSYNQMIYTAAEMGGNMEISRIAFNFAGANQLTSKSNCAIYLGHTSQTTFISTNASSFVPFSQLQKVYEGPMQCVTGWNEFEFDSVFSYNGTDNLVVAIDDNSGNYDGTSYRFYCTGTPGQYTALSYYSDNYNYDPTTSSYSGTKTRRQYRADVRFIGCTQIQHQYNVTAVSSNSQQGSVTGGGVYLEGDTVTVTATPAPGYAFDHWASNGVTLTGNPFSFVVAGDRNFTAYFTPLTYTVTVTASQGGNATGGGSYNWGSNATVTANPSAHYHFVGWTGSDFGDTVRDNPYTFQVFNNCSLRANFAPDIYHITVLSADTELGYAWIVGENSQHLSEAWLPYGSQVELHAEPRTDVENQVYSFLNWSDRVQTPDRTVTLTSDTVIYAYFKVGSAGIEQAAGTVFVTARGKSVEITGAAGSQVFLYDITGRQLHSAVTSGHLSLPVSHPGVYLVRIEGYPTRKVVVTR